MTGRSAGVDESHNYRIESSSDGDTLVVTDHWSPDIDELLRSGRIAGLDLNFAKGFKPKDLPRLDESWGIRRLSLLARTVKDLSPILRLSSTLEELSVQCDARAELDLGQFPSLGRLSASWDHVGRSLGDASALTDLYLGSYPGHDLSDLRWLSGLTRLRLKDRPRLRSLAGVEHLALLEELGVFGAPLEDIGDLVALQRLTELEVESCPVGDLLPLASLDTLRFLNASECGEIASVGPIAGHLAIEHLWLFGSTDVVDHDLAPIAALPRLVDFRMRSRRTYSPSVPEIQALVERRLAS